MTDLNERYCFQAQFLGSCAKKLSLKNTYVFKQLVFPQRVQSKVLKFTLKTRSLLKPLFIKPVETQ